MAWETREYPKEYFEQKKILGGYYKATLFKASNGYWYLSAVVEGSIHDPSLSKELKYKKFKIVKVWADKEIKKWIKNIRPKGWEPEYMKQQRKIVQNMIIDNIVKAEDKCVNCGRMIKNRN